MRAAIVLTALVLACAPAGAQANSGVGLQLTTPAATFGVSCGPFSCIPIAASTSAGATNTLTGFGFPSSQPGSGTFRPILFGISTTPAGCVALPGFGNQLVLAPSLVVFGAGFASGPGFFCAGAHAQGGLTIPFDVPAGVPPGTVVILQAAGITCPSPAACQPAFSRAIQLTIV